MNNTVYNQGKFIIGSKRDDGTLSFSNNPKVHSGFPSANTEASRLARCHPGKEFVIARLDSTVKMQEIVRKAI